MRDADSWLARFAGTLQTIVGASRSWRIVLALLILVVGCLAITPTPPHDLTTGWDKMNHFAAFCALSVSGSLAFPRAPVCLLS